jgi:hypothetical protein
VLLLPPPLLQVIANETYSSFNPRQVPHGKLLSYAGIIDVSDSTHSRGVLQVSALHFMIATSGVT